MNTLSSLLKFIGNRFDRIQGGSVAGTAIAAGAIRDVSVTFPKSYSSTPKVVTCVQSASDAAVIGSIAASPMNVSTTGFTIRIFNNAGSQRAPGVNWIAIP